MKGLSVTAIVIFSVLLLVSVNTSQFAFSDGNDSPAECKVGPTVGSGMIDAGAGNIIIKICIKDGTMAFEDPSNPGNFIQHSQVITVDGKYGKNDCYDVSGMGTQVVTVTDCPSMGLSHVDFMVEPGDMVGGHGGITDNTALLVSGSHLTASWMIPLLVSAIGIGVFVVTRK